jgi:hypothetical protein
MCAIRMSYIGIFSPLEVQINYVRLLKLKNLTWIKIVKNLVLQGGVYDDCCVQCRSSVECRVDI